MDTYPVTHPAHTANCLRDDHYEARIAELEALANEIAHTETLPYPLTLAMANALLDHLLEEADTWDAIVMARRQAIANASA